MTCALIFWKRIRVDLKGAHHVDELHNTVKKLALEASPVASTWTRWLSAGGWCCAEPYRSPGGCIYVPVLRPVPGPRRDRVLDLDILLVPFSDDTRGAVPWLLLLSFHLITRSRIQAAPAGESPNKLNLIRTCTISCNRYAHKSKRVNTNKHLYCSRKETR